MGGILLKNIQKSFGQATVIKNLNLEIKDGSFTVLVGPSGCGKSTTLRMIAGLEELSKGEIWLGDKCVNRVPPGQRDVAMVFQNYALYPTMTVRENIEFGLRNRKVPPQERKVLIEEISEIVGLADLLPRMPSTLSGGQRQRVALARAMVKKPQVFLMDEPLSNLDAKLRHQMRTELIQLHKSLGVTFVYVTHDQVEAMSMGDQIVIMHQGELQQTGSPMELYHNPANLFTAQFIGTPPMNAMESVKVPQIESTEFAFVGFRPEKVMLSSETTPDSVSFSGTITTREILGAETVYQVASTAGPLMVKSFNAPLIEEIGTVFCNVKFSDLFFFNHNGERIRPGETESNPGFAVGGVA